MADDLRRSVQNLESPTCDHCHLRMKWYRSVKLDGEPLVIEHHFSCPQCDRTKITRTTAKGEEVPPPHKLSKPGSGRHAA